MMDLARTRGGAAWLRAAPLYLLVYLCFWTAVPLLRGQEPPSDNIEQLTWALSPALGYSKHPPLPTLTLWMFEQIAPAGLALTYALGALQVLATLGLAYLAGRDSLGESRARLAGLLITCISYHTLRMHYYNHNTALMCATAAAALCTWRAVRRGERRWWAALGIAWGAGMLCKYQMVLTIACNASFVLLALRARWPQALRSLCLAAAVAGLVFMPHFLWLLSHHFPTLNYAAQVLGASLTPWGRLDSLLRFFASQATRLVPALLAIGIMHQLLRRQAPATGDPEVNAPPHDLAPLFWRIHAAGPLLLMAAMTLVGGVDLEMHWGTAFVWAIPPWYLSTQRGAVLGRLAARPALFALAAVQIALMLGKLAFPAL